jgi:uncharacterized membrane protein YhhN
VERDPSRGRARAPRAEDLALLAAGTLAALAYLATLGPSGLRGWAVVVKPVPVLCLAAWCARRARDRSGRLICAGLLVSAVGDVLLVPPRLFLAGVGAFLVAHLCYIAAFLARTLRPRPLRALPFLAWGGAVFAVLAPVLGSLVVPLGFYMAVICVMMWRAAAAVGAGDTARREEWWALGGAVLFGLSDTLLALHRYLTPWPDAPYLVMVLYWAGQAGLARAARAGAGIPARFQYHHAGPPAA